MQHRHQTQIADNVERHERIAGKYVERHSEIYNDLEQQRLASSLEYAISLIESGVDAPKSTFHALDYGCGAGNLTRHLVHLGCEVTAADVAPSFVRMVTDEHPGRTRGLLLNGADLSGVADNTFDMVATYSVLHHVPDYLAIVAEFARVTKPGGIVYIDHEASEEHWSPSPALSEFRTSTRPRHPWTWYLSSLLSPSWWKRRIRKSLNPRYAEEGDIHVWPDDHIEWSEVTGVLARHGVDVVHTKSYLLYQPHYDRALYHRYADSCTDMRVLMGRKL